MDIKMVEFPLASAPVMALVVVAVATCIVWWAVLTGGQHLSAKCKSQVTKGITIAGTVALLIYVLIAGLVAQVLSSSVLHSTHASKELPHVIAQWKSATPIEGVAPEIWEDVVAMELAKIPQGTAMWDSRPDKCITSRSLTEYLIAKGYAEALIPFLDSSFVPNMAETCLAATAVYAPFKMAQHHKDIYLYPLDVKWLYKLHGGTPPDTSFLAN